MNLPNYGSYYLLPGKSLAILASDFQVFGQRVSECRVLGSRALPLFLTVYPGSCLRIHPKPPVIFHSHLPWGPCMSLNGTAGLNLTHHTPREMVLRPQLVSSDP